MEIRGYCVKCKMRGRLIENPVFLKNSNGSFRATGRCEVCGTVCNRFMSAKDKEEYELEE